MDRSRTFAPSNDSKPTIHGRLHPPTIRNRPFTGVCTLQRFKIDHPRTFAPSNDSKSTIHGRLYPPTIRNRPCTDVCTLHPPEMNRQRPAALFFRRERSRAGSTNSQICESPNPLGSMSAPQFWVREAGGQAVLPGTAELDATLRVRERAGRDVFRLAAFAL